MIETCRFERISNFHGLLYLSRVTLDRESILMVLFWFHSVLKRIQIICKIVIVISLCSWWVRHYPIIDIIFNRTTFLMSFVPCSCSCHGSQEIHPDWIRNHRVRKVLGWKYVVQIIVPMRCLRSHHICFCYLRHCHRLLFLFLLLLNSWYIEIFWSRIQLLIELFPELKIIRLSFM